jgi:hypothetical protein
MKALQVKLADNRSVAGWAHGKYAATFQFVNGACVTRISLSYGAIKAMGDIAEALQAVEENKKAEKAKRQAEKAGKA